MPKLIWICPVCGFQHKAWTTEIEFGSRYHIDQAHPEVSKEFKDAEEKIKTLKVALRDKYPGVSFKV